jgi:streptogramin lyase
VTLGFLVVMSMSGDTAGLPYTFSGLAGLSLTGSADGTGDAAKFAFPQAVAVDTAGNVYVADTSNHTIRTITPEGAVSTLAGLAGVAGSTDGIGSAARFNFPAGVAVDSAGNVYVADISNNTIRTITPAGAVSTLAGLAGSQGSTDGSGSTARFSGPRGVAVDTTGNVYVADFGNSTIRKITPAGVVSTWAGLAVYPGSTDAIGNDARFSGPKDLAVDPAGNVYVADMYNSTIRKITPAGAVSTLAGLAVTSGSEDGLGSAARFSFPSGVALDSAGNIYVADSNNYTIRKITPAGAVSTLAGLAGTPGSTEGSGSEARFSFPQDVGVDSAGTVYVADYSNSTIRRVTAAGDVSTWAGPAGSTGSVDGPRAAARFSSPQGAAVDTAGNIYVADTGNNTIRKITPAGAVITLAGLAGTSGSTDGTGSASRFEGPYGVAVDPAGNVYVADISNSTIRKITPAGEVTTLAGLAGSSGSADGTGSAARFDFPAGVAADAAGNVYVADFSSSTIRKITPAGEVTTLAGLANNFGSADGAGSTARFLGPLGLAVDAAGNVYVADNNNHTIRKITPAGMVTTLAGVAEDSGSTDGVGAAARFSFPQGVTVDAAGNVYVADSGNNTIRMGVPANPVLDLNSDSGGDAFLYNVTTGAWRFQLTNQTTAGFSEVIGSWDAGWQISPVNLNGDGYTDFFLYDRVRGLWVQALNAGAGGSFTYTVGNWDRNWTVIPADLDGDGITDMFVYNADTGVWVKCFVDGNGGFVNDTAGQWDPGWTFTTADLNGDRRDDFFLYNQTTGAWVEAFSRAGIGTFDYPASGQWEPGWRITPADLNGDSRVDLFLLSATGLHVSALGRAGGDFDYPVVGQWEAGWAIAPGDFDNDGRTDLFLYNSDTGVWVEALSDGAGDFAYAAGRWDPGWSVRVTDFNGDGLADILASDANGTWVQATNTGPATFAYGAGNWGTGWTVVTRGAAAR